jgi:Mor family transcriptional regulator
MGGRLGNNHWSEERWQRLVEQWCADFGPEAAARIIQSTITAVGSERMSFPSIADLQRRERDRQICNLDLGDNHSELAERFGCGLRTVERVILRQRIMDRQRQNGSHEK